MDINNYSYAPHMLDEDNTVKYFENFDMYAEIMRCRAYSRIYFSVYACSYDGSLEVSEDYDDIETATKLFDFIIENYANTRPDEELFNYIEGLTA